MMRLIDADRLYYKVKCECNPYGKPTIDYESGNKVLNWIENAPTVVNEMLTPERPQGEWIPVSERLPDDMQRVLVWFEYYRYGDYNCMYQTYGFGYVCDGKWSPFINGETGWQDARIIAWMSLPEPFKNGELVVKTEERQHGEWIDEGQYAEGHSEHYYRCSECGGHIIELRVDDFCKHCGADMRKETE